MNARLSTPMNSRIPSQNLTHQAKTKRMVQLALMISIIFVMAFSPLGYLRTPGLTITFLTVPVAVGAVLMGPLAGAVCGLAFGITSLITAMTGGLIFAALRPRFKNASYFIACLACPLLNTVLFMSSLILFFYNTDYVQGLAASLGASNPLIFVILFVGIQGAIEAAACTVLGSAVSRTLAAALKR